MEFLDRMRTRAERARRGEYLGKVLSRGLHATHDYSLANASGAAFRSDLNDMASAIVTQNSGTSWATTFARQVVVDTSAGVKKRRNAANSGWITIDTDDETFVQARSANTMADSSDIGKCIHATGSYTQTLDAAATLGDGWYIDVIVDSGATLVLDPNASENIDGATTKSVVGPAAFTIWCTGTAFFTTRGSASVIAVGSDADGDMWYRASSVIARLAKGAANTKMFMNAGATAPEWASGLKSGSFTRDLSTASGSQAVTGVGFKPSAVIFWAHESGTTKGSLGFTDASTGNCFYNYNAVVAGAWASSAGNILHPIVDLSNLQNGALASLDSDGFTITWTKTGSPTGTVTCYYLALR